DKEGSINTKTYLHIEKQQDHYETVIHGRRLIGHQVYLNTPTQDTAPDTQDPRINALKQWIPISQAVRYNRSEFM
ncbi:hypothetical protein CU098_009969, partial [Rhizopus stolonifer]